MRKTTKLNILVLTFFILFLLLGNTSFALTGKVNSADYTVCIKEDGSVDVTEIMDLSLEKDIDNFSKRFDENIEIKNLEVKEYNKDGEVKIEYDIKNIELTSSQNSSLDIEILSVKEQDSLFVRILKNNIFAFSGIVICIVVFIVYKIKTKV